MSQTAAIFTPGIVASDCISRRQRPPVPMQPTLIVFVGGKALGGGGVAGGDEPGGSDAQRFEQFAAGERSWHAPFSLTLRRIVSPAALLGRILGRVLDHLIADGGGQVDIQLVGQRQSIAQHVGDFLADCGQLRRVVARSRRDSAMSIH